MLLLALACLGESLTPTAASAPADAGPAAWSAHNCLACHGERGEGGVGPALAGRVPSLADLTAQVRKGAPPMPAFSAATLPDAEIAAIRAWLLRQPAPGPPAPNPGAIATQAGVDVELTASGLDHPVALAWGPGPAGDALYASTNGGLFPRSGQKTGKIWRIEDGEPRLFAEGLERPLGMLWIPGPELLVSVRGAVLGLADADGDGRAEAPRVVLSGLPAEGLHQNNGLARGPDGDVYLGMGTRTDADPAAEEPRNGTILAFSPRGGTARVHASGFRNPFDLCFAADGALYATDNGVDPPLLPDAPEEINRVAAGGFYGHPYRAGAGEIPGRTLPAGLRPLPPLAALTPHASANGLVCYGGQMFPGLRGKLLVLEFGSYISRFHRAGRDILAVDPATGATETWASGFVGRPLDALEAPDGSLYVTDFEQGAIWRFFASDRQRTAFKPSFDCRKASTTVEKAICNDPQLAALDGELAAAYQAARAARDEAGRLALRDAQRAWIKRRDACAADAYPVVCVRDAMLQRIAELRAGS